MLNSNDRRDAFDAFFYSLSTDMRARFMDEAMAQHANLLDCERTTVSVIDCMENVWDEWREMNPAYMMGCGQDRYEILMHMHNDERKRAQRDYYFEGIVAPSDPYLLPGTTRHR